jgi:hypothetical protein
MSDTRHHGVDDLDRLVSELHQTTSTRPALPSSEILDLTGWLRTGT